MTVDLLELQSLTETERPITYGVVKPGVEDPEKGVLFVRGGDIADGSIDMSVLRTITQEVSAPYARTILRGGEVVISLVGNPGAVAVVPDSLAGANLARQVGLIALRPEYHAPYVKYYLMSPQGKAELFQRTQGAVQQVINLADLKKIKVRVLPKPEQERIAGVLSAYDDLIENNRRRIALLEQSARLLYREWFVHLRFPGHEHVKVVDGVPEGWTRRTVSELATLAGGKQYESDKLTDAGAYPVFGGNGIQGYSQEKTHDDFVIAFGRVGAYCGSVHWSYEGAWINNNASSLVPHEYPELFLHHMLHCDFRNYRKGAAQPFIPNGVLSTICFIGPSGMLAAEFCEQVRFMRLQQVILAKQNKKLAQARDLLLPRLMSGDLVV